MSVASILAFMAAGAAFKTPLRDKAVESPTRTSYAKLKAEIAELKAEVAELEGKVGKFEDAIATANAHARRDQELIDLWRERALAPSFGQAAPQILLHQMAQAQQNAAAGQLAQYHQAQYHQAQQNQALAQSMGLLGAQMIDAELYCNCVPSRSQVWAANG